MNSVSRLNDRLDVNIVVDWDVKPQSNQYRQEVQKQDAGVGVEWVCLETPVRHQYAHQLAVSSGTDKMGIWW